MERLLCDTWRRRISRRPMRREANSAVPPRSLTAAIRETAVAFFDGGFVFETSDRLGQPTPARCVNDAGSG
jgi:hypothetical protein